MPAPNEEFGRTPLTIVEVDQDQCTLTYGEGACEAAIGVTGDRKCFNSFATCQFREAYTIAPLTMRYAKAQTDLPNDVYIIPSLLSVQTSPMRLNVGGRRDRDEPLGRRSEVTITLQDHPHSDTVVDPYVDDRDYDPLTRGTYWAKWLRRNPFYTGRSLRVLDGYVGQSLEEMQRRHYVIDRIDGPDSNGTVTIRAQDILRLADDDKAQAPALSTGTLFEPISETASSLIIEGAPIAQYQEYDTNAVRISDEVIRYSSISGEDGAIVLSGLTRGADGTEAGSHDEGDTVQACLGISSVSPWEVVRDLLVDFGNVPSEFIPFSDWETEGALWLGGFTVSRLLTEPVGVTKLVGELAEQCLFYVWWDDRAQQIPFRAVRPVSDDQVTLITEDNGLIQNETKLTVRPELRASEVWVSFGIRDAVEDGNERANYRRTRARIDETAASPFADGERRVYEVFSPWLETTAQVDLLGFRLLARYRSSPTYLSFKLDAKDRDIGVADVVDIGYRGFVDDTGQPRLVRYQIISEHEVSSGSHIQYEAQRFDFDIGQRFGNWMVESAPNYGDATEGERATGMWWADAEGLLDGGDNGYVWV